mgnify:CR=1 FL=1
MKTGPRGEEHVVELRPCSSTTNWIPRVQVVLVAREAFGGDGAPFGFILASGELKLWWPQVRLSTAACVVGSCACLMSLCGASVLIESTAM